MSKKTFESGVCKCGEFVELVETSVDGDTIYQTFVCNECNTSYTLTSTYVDYSEDVSV